MINDACGGESSRLVLGDSGLQQRIRDLEKRNGELALERDKIREVANRQARELRCWRQTHSDWQYHPAIDGLMAKDDGLSSLL